MSNADHELITAWRSISTGALKLAEHLHIDAYHACTRDELPDVQRHLYTIQCILDERTLTEDEECEAIEALLGGARNHDDN